MSYVLSLFGGSWLKIALAAVLIAALGLLYGLGYSRGVSSQSATISDLKTTIGTMTALATQAGAEYRDKEKTWADDVADIKAQHAKDVDHDKSIEDALRAAVDAGARKLRIAGVCASGDHSATSKNTDGTGGGDGATVELDPDSRQAYFELRDAIERDTRTIKACQSYVKSVGGDR